MSRPAIFGNCHHFHNGYLSQCVCCNCHFSTVFPIFKMFKLVKNINGLKWGNVREIVVIMFNKNLQVCFINCYRKMCIVHDRTKCYFVIFEITVIRVRKLLILKHMTFYVLIYFSIFEHQLTTVLISGCSYPTK